MLSDYFRSLGVSDSQFTIHYHDGRVEGPIGEKVIRDLIAAGIIGPGDSLATPGNPPTPVSSIAAFNGLIPKAKRSGLQPIPNDQDIQDLSDRTVQMEIPTGGFHPMAIQAEIQARKDAAKIKKSSKTSSDDLFSSVSGVKTRSPIKLGASYQSSQNLPVQSMSIKNPFNTKSGIPKIQKNGFSEKLFKLSATDLRDKLLNLPVPDILGVTVSSTSAVIISSYNARTQQITEHRDSSGSSIIGRAAIEDISNILDLARDILTDESRSKAYFALTAESAVKTPLNKFIDFRFAAVKPISNNENPFRSTTKTNKNTFSSTATSKSTTNSNSRSGSLRSSNIPQPNSNASSSHSRPPLRSATTSTTQTRNSTTSNNPLKRAKISGSKNPRLSSPSNRTSTMASKRSGTLNKISKKNSASTASRSGSRPKASKKTNSNPKKSQKTAKQKRLEQFQRAGWGQSGDPFKGHVAFGVGQFERGITHTLSIFVATFFILFAVISATDMGIKEFSVSPSEPMLFVRPAILTTMALIGLLVIRREKFTRFGFFPEPLQAIFSLICAGLIGFGAMHIARLPVSPESDFGIVVGLLALRAIGEGLFFHGFIARTLLIESKEPAIALFITGILYGIYALTFVEIVGRDPISIIYGVLVYGFGLGMPVAMMYWQSRSVFIPILAQFILFVMAAYAGVEHATINGLP